MGTEIRKGAKIFAPLTDAQGNIRRLIGIQSKTLAASYDFSAFGEKLQPNAKEGLSSPWQFASKRFDPSLGLIYFGKRYYDPKIGRWVTTDPAGFVDGTNLYQFLFNNPFSYVDPDGQFVFLIPLVAWGAGAAAPTLAAIGTYIAAGVATGAVAYGGYKLIEYSCQQGYAPGTVWDAPRCVPQQNVITANKNTDVYAPDRPLPRDEDGVVIPDTDASHTQLGTRDGSKGKYPQAREFDENGNPVRDIDFTDHGRPEKHPNPHQHKHKPNDTGGTSERSKNPEPVPEWRY